MPTSTSGMVKVRVMPKAIAARRIETTKVQAGDNSFRHEAGRDLV